jgi:ABC-type branched-subunit amino acid transport system substrate-binding protein
MSFDFGKVLEQVGDDLLGDAGQSLGLERETAIKAGHALAANWSKGKDEAIKAAAAESGVAEEVVAKLLQTVIDKAREKGVEAVKAAFTEGPVADAVEQAKEQAMEALGGKTGFLGKLFGKK